MENESVEEFGQLIDQWKMGPCAYAADPTKCTVEQMRKRIPELTESQKAVFVKATGENPWTD